MPLFQIANDLKVSQLKSSGFSKERDLQKLFENNLEEILGVRFVAREFSTGDRQRGRIDTLGLDQDGSPVIIEYKKANNDNVINQGLFYLDWLVDHKGDFALAAQKSLGKDVEIDWSSPRLILIAETFSTYDKYAVNRIGVNVELRTYRLYGDDFLYLESIYVSDQAPKVKNPAMKNNIETLKKPEKSPEDIQIEEFTIEDLLKGKPTTTRSLFEELRERIFSIGEEGSILEKANKHIVSYKHGKNFCEIWIQSGKLKLWLDITCSDLNDPYNLARDVSGIGHWGTGTVEVGLSEPGDLPRVVDLITQAYHQTL